jgi:hypothetical protein
VRQLRRPRQRHACAAPLPRARTAVRRAATLALDPCISLRAWLGWRINAHHPTMTDRLLPACLLDPASLGAAGACR